MDFQIIKGSPTDEEIAALTVALAQMESKSQLQKSASPRSVWGRPILRRPLETGVDGWRRSWR